ncbi:Fic family protein [Pedobacter sp. GR22-6]|uniref:Fic family protein n=1 Tax=Pedobacter sp. GR22-6 TaxID=3127957 RepID=UPI00307DD370
MTYNWQLPDWPAFSYDFAGLQSIMLDFAKEVGEVNGILQSLPQSLQEEALIQLMISEAVKTSEIEGEYLSREDVTSSIRNNLGLNEKPISVKDRRASGIANLMIEVRKTYQDPLNASMLQQWHFMLMEHARGITPGVWRSSAAPMQVISGSHGRETVHYEAPPSDQMAKEMDRFIHWFNTVKFELEGDLAEAILKSALAHLYFESIHPFEDGNGRIGRAISEKAIAISLKRPVMLSLSKVIEKDKKTYYKELKKAQQTLVVTDWLSYFAGVILEAQREAKITAQFTVKKAHFYDRYKDQLNERQLKVMNKMLEKGSDGFQGGMTAAKYMAITRISKATATRDLQQLYEIAAMTQEGGGRSVRYHLNI